MKKKLLILLAIIVLAGLAYSLYSFLTQEWRGNENIKYTNTKHSYSFQYSPDWNLMGDASADILMFYNTENAPGDGGLPAGIKMEVMALENYDDLNLEEWVGVLNTGGEFKLTGETTLISKEEVKVAGLKAIRQTSISQFDDAPLPISIYFAKGDYIFMISYLGSEPDYSEQMGNFDLVLKTFNFN